MMTDVLIIGAGMAGLSAGLACRSRGIDFRLFEAGGETGGRAITRRTAAGTAVDLGAHWMHGEDTPLHGLLSHYGLTWREDRGQFLICENGTTRRDDGDWLEKVIDQEKAGRVRSGAAPDCPLPDLGVDGHARQILTEFALMWNGIDPPVEPSAREFLTDENTPGGLQPDGGVGAVMARMAAEVGHDRIRLHTAVTRMTAISDGVQVEAADGTRWNARRAIFTGSLAVLKSGMVRFEPGLSRATLDHLDGLVMGEMNKIVVELEAGFFDERGIEPDTAIELLDARPPHFCHLRSAGLPTINLYVSGRRARDIERLNADQALGYVSALLKPVKALAGFEAHVVGEPILSHWVGNPFTRGAYSACLPGYRRSGPRVEGAVVLSGDTFDDRFPASLAGAFRSGQAAVEKLCELGLHLEHHQAS